MKKSLSLIFALIMLISAIPFTAYADTWPMPDGLSVSNAVGGVCEATVELSWTPSTTPSDFNHQVFITKSLDGENFTKIGNITGTKVKTQTTYSYTTVDEDYGKTVTFGVQYEYNGSSTLNASHRRTVSVQIKKPADDSESSKYYPVPDGQDAAEFYKEKIFECLADKTVNKKTEKYDGLKYVVGTKVTWDTKLYVLTAKVTKISGKKITFDMTFDSKIPKKYIEDAEGWDMYWINVGTKTFYLGDKITYTWDTSEAKEGMNFLRINIENHARNAFIIYPGTNRYYNEIKNNRDVAPDNGASSINEVWIDDILALPYYVKPELYLNTGAFNVKQKSISLGKYTFKTIVYWKAKSAKSWKKKTFAANKNILFKGLKPGSQYYFRALFAIPYTDMETDKKMEVVDSLQDAFYLNTAPTKKPAITSIKVSKCKYGKETINGYWESDGDWHPTETFNNAKYTLTVKVKSSPKNIKGLYMKYGNAVYYAKGRKKSYTFKVTYRDTKKVKGKKLTPVFAYSANTFTNSPVGLGPVKKFSYKVKNGTYK